MRKILVYRFSAMGDVVMLLPVLKGILDCNPDVEIHLLTQKNFFPFFCGIDRLFLIQIDTKHDHHNFIGLLRLFQRIKKTLKPDLVIDLHCVLRSYVLDIFFLFFGYKVKLFPKDSLRKFIKIAFKTKRSLISTIERYSIPFTEQGFKFCLPKPSLLHFSDDLSKYSFLLTNKPIIGIAPFAKHPQKMWGIHKVEELIKLINSSYDVNFLFFGVGSEIDLLTRLTASFSNCFISAKYFNLEDEIEIIQQMTLMISMDSANAHIASMSGIPVVSIWGATHPSLGFYPYMQPFENIIQYNGDLINCRPCSVYGNKKCKYDDGLRCMSYISANDVFVRIKEILG